MDIAITIGSLAKKPLTSMPHSTPPCDSNFKGWVPVIWTTRVYVRSIKQDLAELVRADYVGDNRNVSRGVGESNGESSATSHVAGARAMPLALTALLGLVRHLELEEDSAKHHTFSLTMGKTSEDAVFFGQRCCPTQHSVASIHVKTAVHCRHWTTHTCLVKDMSSMGTT